jgi:hypothetical protein
MGFKEDVAVGFTVLLVGGGVVISAKPHHRSHVTTAGAAIMVSISPDAGVPGGSYVHPHAAGGYVDPIPYSPVDPSSDRRYLGSGRA